MSVILGLARLGFYFSVRAGDETRVRGTALPTCVPG